MAGKQKRKENNFMIQGSILAIAGATVSSNAVITALNSAIDCYNNEIKGVA